jgi:hypothetical protein
MLRRPPLRTVLATAAAAALLVGGADLAANATTSHGHGAASAKPTAQPRTITFHIGKPGKKFQGGSTHLLSAKVPQGTYEVAVSGFLLVNGGSGTATYSCLVADRKTILKGLNGGFKPKSFRRVYALDGDGQGSFKFGDVNNFNPAQKIDRPIAMGCILSGSGTFTVARTVTFTLRPVKVTAKSGTPIFVTRSETRRLSGVFH